MKRFLVSLLFITFNISIYSQNIYIGATKYNSDIIANVSKGVVYKGSTKSASNIIAIFDGKYLYKGKTKYRSNIIGTWSGGKMYKGCSTYESDLIGVYRNGKLYDGNSQNVIFRYVNNNLHFGNSLYRSSILINTSGYIHPIIFYFLII